MKKQGSKTCCSVGNFFKYEGIKYKVEKYIVKIPVIRKLDWL